MTCRYHLRLSQVDWLKKMMAVTLTFGHIVLVGHVGNRKYSAHFMRPRASDRALSPPFCVKMLQIERTGPLVKHRFIVFLTYIINSDQWVSTQWQWILIIT